MGVFLNGQWGSGARLSARVLPAMLGTITDLPGHAPGSRVFFLGNAATRDYITPIEGIPPQPNAPFPYGMIVEPDR